MTLISGLLFFSVKAVAQVNLSGGVAPVMCVGDLSYVTISDIVVAETSNTDFDIQNTNRTIRIDVSAGSRFQFQPGIGSVSFTGTGSGSVTASIGVTATRITITLIESSNTNAGGLNTITISGVRVRAITAAASLLLRRVSGGNPLTITGFPVNTNIPSSSLVSNAPPSTADAGTDQIGANAVCGGSTTLNAANPSVGTGQWSFVVNPGGGNITNINNRLSSFTGTPGQTYELQWTVSNGVCTPSTDNVIIQFDASPSSASAGGNQIVCGTVTSLNATAPGVGVGEWSLISNPDGLGAIGDPYSPTSMFSGAAGSTYGLRWTVTSGVCPPSHDNITIQFVVPPSSAQAGPNQNLCEAASFIMAATAPSVGVGEWTLINGTATITNPLSRTSTVTGIPFGTSATLRWTITNGTCPTSVDDVVLTNHITPPVADADAGSPVTEQCNNSTFTMAANAASPDTGVWTIVSGTATLTNINSPTTTVTGVTAGSSVTLRWTISNGGVCADTFDEITITNHHLPTTASAGVDQNQCDNTVFTLSGNNPSEGTGAWTIVSGSGTITDPTQYNSTVTGVTAGTSTTLRWTITNGTCPTSVDDVVLTNHITPPVADADAGSPVTEQCNNSTFTMAANAASPDTGVWTIVSGTATLTNINSPTTTVTGVTAGSSVTLRWTISNGGVCADTFDEITITNYDQLTVSVAGADQFNCNDGNFTLNGNPPVFGTGVWSIIGASNGATITDVNSPTSTVTGLTAGTSVTLRWTIGNGICANSTSDVVLTNTLGAMVDAGSNAEICEGTTFNFSSQSIPASAANYVSLLWESIGTPPTGTLFNATTLTPTYQPGIGETGLLQFRLTAVGIGVCAPVTDVMEVTITPRPVVDAGSNEQVCEGTTVFDFASRAVPATAANGTVAWTHNGTGSLDNASLLNPQYTIGTGDIGNEITFTLTVTSGSPTVCTTVQDQFTLRVNPRATATIPGGDFSVCEPATINLSGTIGGSALSGSWSIVSGGGGTLSVSSITGNVVTATYTRLPSEINTVITFRLTTNDPDGAGPCSEVSADVNVTVDESAKVFAGANMNICEYDAIPLSGTFSGAATSVTWSGGFSAAQYDDVNSAITNYNLNVSEVAANNLSYTFTLTTNDPPGVCPAASSQVVVQVIDRLDPANITIFGLNAVYAENDNPVTLVGFPGGGVFSGDAVSGNKFFPNIANITPLTNTVVYSVTDGFGCVSTHSQGVVVNPITDVSFTIANEILHPSGTNLVCAKQGEVRLIETPDVDIANIPFGSLENVVFTSPDLPSGSIYYDNTPGVESYMLRTDLLVAGEYHIIYEYTNEFNATNPFQRIIRIASSPKPVIDNTNICETSQANFIESSYIDEDPMYPTGAYIEHWQWDFGDGNGSTSQNPVYNYPAGIYTVKLKVTTNEGCYQEASKVINVGSTPEVKFDWTEFCSGNFTKFVDQTNVAVGSITDYKWTFGDGDEITAPTGYVIPTGEHSGRTEGLISAPDHRYTIAGQQYNITLQVQTDVGCVESLTRTAFILEYETPSPITGYFEDFESGAASWFANRIEKLTPSDTSWVFGLPPGGAASGNFAWWTGANANAATDYSTYYNNEKSAVIGPCQDISHIKRPMISIDYWSDTPLGSDGAVLQYSTNGGIDWQAIGEDNGNGLNWYNSRAITGNPGGQAIGQFGWTGEQAAAGWKTARYNLDQIAKADRSKVIFRIAFGSNNDNTFKAQPLKGFAFDNIYIGEKKRTVMVEYFTNAGINQATLNGYFDDMYDNQFSVLHKDSSDFFKLQYHIANPSSDPINLENPVDPSARVLYYGIRQPPAAIMDGILGNYYGTDFNGSHQKITTQEIDRRALEDPLFDIAITGFDPTSSSDSLHFDVEFTYTHPTQALSNPVTFQVVLLEDRVGGSGIHRNVVRKFLLGTEGRTVNKPWTLNDTERIAVKSVINVPIGNNQNNLYIAVFVQDRRSEPNAPRTIHQSLIYKVPVPRTGKLVTSVGDDPVLAQVNDIVVYPNPASHQVNFRAPEPLVRQYEWSIVDQRGVTVLSGNVNRDLTTQPQQVDITNLADGMYIVAFRQQGGKPLVYRKIVVMKR